MDRNDIEWVTVYRSASEKHCRERAFVLHAAEIVHEVRQEAAEFTIAVAPADAERSRAELEAYARENPDWPEDRPAASRQANGEIVPIVVDFERPPVELVSPVPAGFVTLRRL